MFRPRGELGTAGRYLHSVTYYSIMIKMSYALVTQGEQDEQDEQAEDVPSEAEVMAAMPTASELLAMADTGTKHLSGQLNYASTPLILAEVCERHGAYERAIDLATLGLPVPDQAAEYTDISAGHAAEAAPSASTRTENDDSLKPAAAGGVENDITGTTTRRCGYDVRPSVHIRASTILGRCFACQGQLREATDAFETAIRVAERYGYKLLQLFGKLGVTQSTYPSALVKHDVAAPLLPL